jgi:CheY-like chemotaxis protein
MASFFIVEDEALIRMMVAEMVADLGHEIAAEAGSLSEALKIGAACPFDVAILDLNLMGQNSEPVADLLEARGIPFVFASGYGGDSVSEKHRDRPTLMKPFAFTELEKCIRKLLPGQTGT